MLGNETPARMSTACYHTHIDADFCSATRAQSSPSKLGWLP